jgi:1,4-alpha-glucan branching enzyme
MHAAVIQASILNSEHWDFKNLVEDAHALGLKVIIDWVANHTGCDHHWTTEHPDWYLKDEQEILQRRMDGKM